MAKKWVVLFFMISAVMLTPKHVFAASEDECAIWICLPGGFPSECGGAYKAYIERIKDRKPPLPSLGECGGGNGHYEMGYEYFYPCENKYVLREIHDGSGRYGACFEENCAPELNDLEVSHGKVHYRNDDETFQFLRRCDSYVASVRPQPRFIKMWVEGQYLGQFFY